MRFGFIAQSRTLPSDFVALYQASNKDPNIEVCTLGSRLSLRTQLRSIHDLIGCDSTNR